MPLLRRSRRSMTLLELIITLVILAILAAIALPSLQSATNNVALTRDEVALVNLTTVAQTVALHHGQQIPDSTDYTQALSSATYQAGTGSLITDPTSILADPPPGTGTMVPSTAPGQVSVNSGTLTVDANGKTTPIGGAAMLTNQGDCIMVTTTPAKVVVFAFPNNPSAPVECSGAEAINGPGQKSPTIPSTAPPAPTTVTLTGSLPSLVANWTAVPDIYAYNLDLYTGSTLVLTTTLAPSNLTYTFTGLSATTYTVKVSGINSAGQGPPGTATWIEPPDAPINVIAAPVPNTTSATITWTPAPTGGVPVTFTVTSVQDPSKTCMYAVGATPPDQCTITGLTLGNTYTFTVTATNPGGTSPPSAPSNPIVIGTVPGAPDAPNVTYTYGTTASVSWSPPSDTGGGSITGYTVKSNPAGSGCVTTTATSCTVSGLVGGVNYTFAVKASNQYGYGPYSPWSPAITPITAPAAPTGVVGVPGDSQVAVTWVAPTDNGGSPITGYTVTGSGGQTCTTTGALTCTVTGLTNGTAYTFVVLATNNTGPSGAPNNGPNSAPSDPVTPRAPPTAPTSVVAVGTTSGPASADVSWTAPSNNGGFPITGYVVTGAPGGQVCTTTGTTSCVVTGLTIGTTYTFTVTATNGPGGINSSLYTSPASLPSNPVTPYTLPDPPTNLTVNLGDTQVTVGWTPPANNGGSDITSYTVTATLSGATVGTCTYTVGDSPSNKCTVTGLTNGTNYTFSVVSNNAAGSSTPVTITGTPYGAPATPDAPTVVYVPGNTTAVINWSAPANNGAPITSYNITGAPGSSCSTTGSPPAVTCTVSGLVAGDTYTYTFTATNTGTDGNSKTSSPSPPSSPITVSGHPLAPTSPAVSYSPGSTSATISWTAPTNDGFGNSNAAQITSYTVAGTPGGSCTSTAPTAPTTSCTVTGLTPGQSYTFTVYATNSVSLNSVLSAPTAPITVVIAPSAPLSPVASYTLGTTFASISWAAPSQDGYDNTSGAEITSYTVTGAPGGACTTTGSPAPTTCTVTGLTPGSSYTFTVTATNASSLTGPASVATTPFTVYVTPTWAGPVTASSPSSSTLTYSWPAASATGGGSVTYYYSGACTGSTASTSVVCSGLTSGTPYTLNVYAQNTGGLQTPTYSGTGTTSGSPYGSPDTPTVSATSESSSSISWSFSNSSYGSGTTQEQFFYHDSDGYCSGSTSLSTSFSGSITCPGMPSSTSDTLYVYAQNNQGNASPTASATASTVVVIGAPTTPSVSATSETMTSISWAFSNTSYGSGASSEYFSYYDTAGGCSGTTSLSTALSGGVTCTGLSPSSGHELCVNATNNGGISSAWACSPYTATLGTPISPPASPVITGTLGQTNLTFTATDSNFGGASSLSYSWTDTSPNCSTGSGGSGAGCGNGTMTSTSGAGSTNLVDSGLTRYTAYSLTLTAWNSAGSASTTYTFRTLAGQPDRPTFSAESHTQTSVTFTLSNTSTGGTTNEYFTWFDSSPNAGCAPSTGSACGYPSGSGGGYNGFSPTLTKTFTDTGLRAGTSYTITAYTTNSSGQLDASSNYTYYSFTTSPATGSTTTTTTTPHGGTTNPVGPVTFSYKNAANNDLNFTWSYSGPPYGTSRTVTICYSSYTYSNGAETVPAGCDSFYATLSTNETSGQPAISLASGGPAGLIAGWVYAANGEYGFGNAGSAYAYVGITNAGGTTYSGHVNIVVDAGGVGPGLA